MYLDVNGKETRCDQSIGTMTAKERHRRQWRSCPLHRRHHVYRVLVHCDGFVAIEWNGGSLFEVWEGDPRNGQEVAEYLGTIAYENLVKLI